MLDTAKLLTNVGSVNLYDVVDQVSLRQGNPDSVYLRLWQSDKDDRYIPATGASLTVNFLRSNSVGQTPVNQTVSVPATNPYADDRSIWRVDLTNLQVNSIISGRIQFLLVENAVGKLFFVKEAIIKVPISGLAV
jgi:hypothetical protein